MAKRTVELNAQNFKGVVEKQGIVFVDFWAPWCGPCRSFAPIFEGAAEKHADIVWGKLNTDDEGELSETFQIRSIPTLMIFKDGYPVFEQAGMLPAAALDDLAQKARALDMAAVRAEAEKQA